MEEDFVNDELSAETLSAFEKRAMQKLKDLADFITIYSDTSLSIQFRMQAKQMIGENFINKAAVLEFYENLELQEDTVIKYLFISGNEETFKTKLNGISISERLQKKSASNYSGEIQFSQNVSVSDSVKTGVMNYGQCKMEIQAVKTEKKFGNKLNDVWEVYLGEIRL
jgi:hypothetical protein